MPNPDAEQMLPDSIQDEDQLDELLSRPSARVVDVFGDLDGDVIFLGVAGKMGPSLARMAVRASDSAGVERRILGVSRFSDPGIRTRLEDWGIRTIQGDLLDRRFLDSLPDVLNVVYMAAMKFGATGNEPLTWAMNTHLPTLVCERFPGSRIAAFSTGNVYGLVPVDSGGSLESDALRPVGEYAMSCLGRERMFEYFCQTQKTPTSLLRLNYAVELRYGVLVDLAWKVFRNEPIDLAMGHVNVIWQGDANATALCSLSDASTPANVVNIAGPELLPVRDVCSRLGNLLDRPVRFAGSEADDALLSNGNLGWQRYGEPTVAVERMLQWIADWVQRGGRSLNKPTHFESRSGKF